MHPVARVRRTGAGRKTKNVETEDKCSEGIGAAGDTLLRTVRGRRTPLAIAGAASNCPAAAGGKDHAVTTSLSILVVVCGHLAVWVADADAHQHMGSICQPHV